MKNVPYGFGEHDGNMPPTDATGGSAKDSTACKHYRKRRHMQPAASNDMTCEDCGAVILAPHPAPVARPVQHCQFCAGYTQGSEPKGLKPCPGIPAGGEDVAAWHVALTCCGRDDGSFDFDTWDAADRFREQYTSGPAVDPHGYSGTGPGHQRSAVISRGTHPKEPRT